MRSIYFCVARSAPLSLLLWCITVFSASDNHTTVVSRPSLYSDAPLTATPDELLQLTGYNLANVEQLEYFAVNDGSPIPEPPVVEGVEPNADQGYANIIAHAVLPETLTVHWPATARKKQMYAIWVKNHSGAWSNALLVNEPRPLWFTPAVISESAQSDTLPRRLHLIGRHLNTTDGKTWLRLVGPQTVTLQPENADGPLPLIAYRRTFVLPQQLKAGRYRVDYSEDGLHWQSIAEQLLDVRSTRPSAPVYHLDETQFGACRPNDGRDDSECLRRALAKAAISGATIYFDEGQWDLFDAQTSSVDGLVVPFGVSLTGVTGGGTSLLHHQSTAAPPRAMLSLAGENRVEKLWLRQVTDDGSQIRSALLQLGTSATNPTSVEVAGITLLGNRFTDVTTAIIDGGHSLRNLIIANNEFAADGTAIYLGNNRYQVTHRLLITDAVITRNIFHPTGKERADPAHNPIASELGAALRMDFSDNQALSSIAGISSRHAGWRAGFFWALNDNVEELLVSGNEVQCAGSGGDGEAFAFDHNANTYAYLGMQPVAAADAQSVTIATLPISIQNKGQVNVNTYYVGHWLQIVDGVGNGQSRRIVSYEINAIEGTTRYFVAPEFAVIPATKSSKAIITRTFSNLTVVGNIVDNRETLCSRNNRINQAGFHGGSISVWGPTQSAVIAHNAQYNTDGIVVQHSYGRPGRGCDNCENATIRHVSLDVVDNEIIGEYEWTSDCSQSGIQLRYGAAPTPDYPPPILGLNTRIIHNHIAQADGLHGGAISLPLAWHAGPSNFRGALISGTLIEGNQISNIDGAPPRATCEQAPARIGINLQNGSLVAGTVLHGNHCSQVTRPLLDRAQATVRYCTGRESDVCECGSTSR